MEERLVRSGERLEERLALDWQRVRCEQIHAEVLRTVKANRGDLIDQKLRRLVATGEEAKTTRVGDRSGKPRG